MAFNKANGSQPMNRNSMFTAACGTRRHASSFPNAAALPRDRERIELRLMKTLQIFQVKVPHLPHIVRLLLALTAAALPRERTRVRPF